MGSQFGYAHAKRLQDKNRYAMNLRIKASFLILFLLTISMAGQQDTYTIAKAPFSTDQFDEFAPVFYNNGLVFCSSRGKAVTDQQGMGVVKIYYADTAANNSSLSLFSKNLRSKLNDGPVTFNQHSDTLYYSRNLIVEGKYKALSSSRNKLGLFYAVKDSKDWSNVREMRFNNEWYNITMPSLSHDGKRLYFVSDKPEGYGGTDIYYSEWNNGFWGDPVNLGPQINTKGNESYPFINESGELFFSSDGHPGLGGKDIFVTKEGAKTWFTPVRLDAPVNSESDDFGIVTDALMKHGYFSSNRGKSIDIYRFTTNITKVWFSEEQKKNRYCFTVSDTGSIVVDNQRIQYIWDFGDNATMSGIDVWHCYPGPGNYSINLDLVDRVTGNIFFRKLTYDIELVDYEQPFITSPDHALVGESIELHGLHSYCPGYDITGFYWDFGDNTYSSGGKVSHIFRERGEYDISLGLTMVSKTTGVAAKRAVTKKVIVFRTEKEREIWLTSREEEEQDLSDIRQFENIRVKSEYSAETDFFRESVFRVELLSSPSRLSLNDKYFNNVPANFTVKEIYNSAGKSWSYYVDEQMTLMATYPAYNEIVGAGYTGARVRISVLTDPAERELQILKKNYGVMTDTYFDAKNKLITNAYLMLDQVVALMNRYPDIKLEINVHTDNQGQAARLQLLSERQARVITDYLISRGINGNRLTARGLGGVRPVSSNATWLERRFNRRVEFIISR